MTFDPIRQEMFRAEKGGGAFVNNTRLRVAGRKKIENLLIGLSCTKPMEQTSMLYQKGCSIRVTGSGALDIAYLAAGRLDVAYMDTGLRAWDIAAGILLVREAGGTATDLTLKPAAALSDVGVLAANPTLHKEYADLLGLSK
jgi:myo-inositol-1(or 4)-monophosphatase